MDEDQLNIELRKFLKKSGITSQRETEAAVHEAVDNGRLEGNEALAVKATVTIQAPGTATVVEDDIRPQ